MYFKDMFSQYLSGYRSGYRCGYIDEAISMFCYISLVCAKTTLEEGDVGLALLTDLSKAFTFLQCKLLICKL